MPSMSDDCRLIFDIVAEFTQCRKVHLDPNDSHSPTFPFRGGTTLIVNQNGSVRYTIRKKIHDRKEDDNNVRLKRQREYLLNRQSEIALAPYANEKTAFDRALKADFRMIHRGY
jgi:hypothetical protein